MFTDYRQPQGTVNGHRLTTQNTAPHQQRLWEARTRCWRSLTDYVILSIFSPCMIDASTDKTMSGSDGRHDMRRLFLRISLLGRFVTEEKLRPVYIRRFESATLALLARRSANCANRRGRASMSCERIRLSEHCVTL